MLPGFLESPWQSKVFSPQSQVELHLWGNLRYQKKVIQEKDKRSKIQIIWYQYETCGLTKSSKEYTETPEQITDNSKTWVNGIFGRDSLTITTKFGVTSAEVPLKFAQIINL